MQQYYRIIDHRIQFFHPFIHTSCHYYQHHDMHLPLHMRATFITSTSLKLEINFTPLAMHANQSCVLHASGLDCRSEFVGGNCGIGFGLRRYKVVCTTRNCEGEHQTIAASSYSVLIVLFYPTPHHLTSERALSTTHAAGASGGVGLTSR